MNTELDKEIQDRLNRVSLLSKLAAMEKSEKSGKVPIRRGCPNRMCYCTGRCQEIIGWRDKIAGEY